MLPPDQPSERGESSQPNNEPPVVLDARKLLSLLLVCTLFGSIVLIVGVLVLDRPSTKLSAQEFLAHVERGNMEREILIEGRWFFGRLKPSVAERSAGGATSKRVYDVHTEVSEEHREAWTQDMMDAASDTVGFRVGSGQSVWNHLLKEWGLPVGLTIVMFLGILWYLRKQALLQRAKAPSTNAKNDAQ